MFSTKRIVGIITAALYVATIYAANWALKRYGFVGVGFGLTAPAGVYFAGLAFSLRDLLQDTLGKRAVVVAVALGAAASFSVSGRFAVASATAFGLSELADFAVYTPLRKRGWLRAVAASNVVGLIVDSAIFLKIAFGSLSFIQGQIVGKVWVTALFVGLSAAARRALPRRVYA